MTTIKARQGFGLVFTLALLFSVFFLSESKVVFGAHTPQHYDYAYNFQNIYDNNVLIYDLTNLDVTQQYTFTLQAIDIDNGFPTANLHSQIIGPGVAVATVAYGQFLGSWPLGSHFPMQVVDNFDQILGEHFITPGYAIAGAWDSVGGAVAVDDKQALVGAIYNPRNAALYQHESDLFLVPFPIYVTDSGFHLDTQYPKTSIVSKLGDYITLHYQRETPFVETTDKIQIKDIATDAVIAEFVLSELDCFSKFDPGAVFGENRFAYIVLTTDGIIPSWMDEDRINTCFSASTDPSSLSVPDSAYSYGRVTTVDVLKDEGESVWIQSVDPAGTEWDLRVTLETVREGSDQRINRIQYTSAAHDGFPVQNITDTGVGAIDSTNYAFARFRSGFYSPDFNSPTIVTWNLQALDLRFGQVVADFPLEISESFRMVGLLAPRSRTESITDAFTQFNLDNDLGGLIVLLISTFLAFSLAFALKAPGLLYVLFYLIIVGVLIIMEMFSPEVRVLVGLTAFAAVIMTFIMPSMVGGTHNES